MGNALVEAEALWILDRLLLGHLTYHRRPDAWDLLDNGGRVAAIICTRPASGFVSISLPLGPGRSAVKRGARIVKPYDEEVTAYVTEDGHTPKRRRTDGVVLSLEAGREFLLRLAELQQLHREEGRVIATGISRPL